MKVDKLESIVALAGGIASGKTTVSEVFRGNGFNIVELSDVIRDYLLTQGVENPSRDQYFDAGTRLCLENGRQFIMEEAIRLHVKPNSKGRVLLSGPRRPEDILILRDVFKQAVVVGINLGIQQRIDRVLERKRGIDGVDVATILGHIQREWKDDDENGCQLEQVMPLCDVFVDTTGTIEETSEKINQFIKELLARD